MVKYRPRNKLQDPYWLIPRLSIIDRTNKVRPLAPLYAEQWVILRTLIESTKRNKLLLKPRQMGATTIVLAYIWFRLLTCPDPLSALSVTHEGDASKRCNGMMRHFGSQLPRLVFGGHAPDNADEIGFPHNQAVHRHLMAGGRGQGRSYTYPLVHFTEMGRYPKGSAAAEGTDVDRDVVASVQATQHDGPWTETIIESTGDGPRGIFYDMVKLARVSDEWDFLFFRWFDFPFYRKPVRNQFRDEPLTPHEQDLIDRHNLTLEQLAFRRYKLFDEGYTRMRFRREYPETWEDPFLPTDEGTWFDVELLNRALGRLPAHTTSNQLDVYHEVEPWRKYFIGMDTAGGTGGDYAVIVVLRDDFEVVAVWRSNTAKPETDQPEVAAAMSGRYNNAPVLCELNNYGGVVIDAMTELGVNLWKDDEGKDFWTQGGRAGSTKKMVYSYGRELVDHGHAVSVDGSRSVGCNDPIILTELMSMREGPRGDIAAPEGSHDDHADAYILALWNGRHVWRIGTSRPRVQPERAKLQRLQKLRRGRV